MHIYQKQQEIMHVIAQGIKDIQEENDVRYTFMQNHHLFKLTQNL